MGYRIEGYTTTTEVQGGTNIVKVREYHVYATPSETYFQFRDPVNITGIVVQERAAVIAAIIADLLAESEVTDVVYSQDVTPGGQLLDVMTTYWQTDGGAKSGFVETPYADFHPDTVNALIAADIASAGV